MRPGVFRALAISAVVVSGLAVAVANAGVGASEPSVSLGNAQGLNYRSVSFSDGFSTGGIDLFATCKDTAAVVGGGVHVSGPAKKSRVGYGFPGDDSADGDSVPEDWWEGAADNFSSAEREITTYSVCRKAGVEGVSYRQKEKTGVAVGASVSIKAKCPGGSPVVAGGSDLYTGNVPVSLPFDGHDGNDRPDDGWRVKALNDDDFPQDITAYAVCLEGADPAYRSETGKTPANGARTISAECPGSMAVTAGGISIEGAPAKHFVHSTRPRDTAADGNDVPDDRWSVTAVNKGGSNSATKIIAICIG